MRIGHNFTTYTTSHLNLMVLGIRSPPTGAQCARCGGFKGSADRLSNISENHSCYEVYIELLFQMTSVGKIYVKTGSVAKVDQDGLTKATVGKSNWDCTAPKIQSDDEKACFLRCCTSIDVSPKVYLKFQYKTQRNTIESLFVLCMYRA